MLSKLKSIFFRNLCPCCEASISNFICGDCYKKLIFLSNMDLCKICGIPIGVKDFSCASCITKRPEYSIARSVFIYDDNSSSMIKRYKFSDKTLFTKLYADLIISHCGDLLNGADTLIPVPLHKIRIIKRKYNQAALLVRSISKKSNIPYEMFSLKRIRNTVPQYSLSNNRLRRENIKGSIKNVKPMQDKTLVLIDDVMTSGATINVCTRELIKSGAKEVRVITLARVIR